MAKERYLTYKVSKKKIFGEERWSMALHYLNRRTFDDLAADVQERSTGLRGEGAGMLQAYMDRIRFHIMAGDSVNIEGLGTFYPKVSSKLVDTEEEATVDNCVRNVVIGFRPCRELMEKIKESGYVEFAPAKNVNKKERKK